MKRLFDPPDLKPPGPQAHESELGPDAEELLKEANDAYKEGLAEPRAWLALRAPRQRPTWLLHGGLALASAAAVVWYVRGGPDNQQPQNIDSVLQVGS